MSEEGFALRQPEARQEAETGFEDGQEVWVDGRPATFCYLIPAGAAVVRYPNERDARVVPTHKLATAPPPSAGGDT